MAFQMLVVVVFVAEGFGRTSLAAAMTKFLPFLFSFPAADFE